MIKALSDCSAESWSSVLQTFNPMDGKYCWIIRKKLHKNVLFKIFIQNVVDRDVF